MKIGLIKLALIGLLCSLIISSSAFAGEWILMTTTYDGTVTMNKGLTKRQCEQARKRVLGLPLTKEEEKRFKSNSNTRIYHDGDKIWISTRFIDSNGDIERAECFK